MYTYYKLLDEKYNGFIVRSHGDKSEYFDVRTGKWIETGLMIRFFSDESDSYNMYEIISEEIASKELNQYV